MELDFFAEGEAQGFRAFLGIERIGKGDLNRRALIRAEREGAMQQSDEAARE